ncbi:MAG: DUF4329 domain-containing protein [Acutalibacteraceae bacterium]
MDEAAIDWAYYYHPRAIKEKVEYGSNFFKVDEKYCYEIATKENDGSVAIPETVGSVGFIHSHHNSDKPKTNIFAIGGDVDVSENRRIIGYVVTPAGDIQKYTPLGNYDEDIGVLNLGRLEWIYYDWRKLSSYNGWKFPWNKNELDKRLGQLRASYGSIIGQEEYYEIWNLFMQG